MKIEAKNVTKIFGRYWGEALEMIEQGVGKAEIMEKTGNTVGVHDVSFGVEEGETVVVMGLSGSGKSTLIRCINRLIEPTRGTVIIEGEDIMKYDHHQLRELRRRKLGMVFQHFALFPHRTVLRNAAYGLEVQGVDKKVREDKARETLSLVGLEGWENQIPAQLSGGMLQRVGLARALAVDPDILLMDEAFSALDPLIRQDMQDELLKLQERVKKTILFITHDLDEALKIGDRIILMNEGRVVQTGTAEEILTTPADDYVERFVEGVDRSRVLTAQAVMRRPRAVGFENDGPRTALHRMKGAGISALFVVKRDYSLAGVVSAEEADREAGQGKTLKDICRPVENSVGLDEPLNNLIPILAEISQPVPVVDEKNRLQGVIVKGSLLGGLAEGGGR
ncbi:MAG: glycine betaine/L-proline ABC transporter ATP-binding protein [bacterium]